MDQTQTPHVTAGGDANPVDTTGLCLLSLDGGGVRGLSTLHVLKVIMDQLNHERASGGLDRVKPCDVFDMIGGTSTGGLIAIMLGRLQMDVDECIAAYNELSAGVFAKPRRRFSISFRAKVASRFDSAKLKTAILEIIASRDVPPDTPFNDGQDRGCKTFVCAASKDLNGIERLRAYSYPWKESPPCTICDAALATSAASGFFDTVQIGARQYIDGALGANNPVEQVEAEASDFWCRDSGDLKPLVKCFVSIGTGNPGKKPIEDRVDKFISETLVGIATETEKTAELFIDRWRQHYDERRFFRFNVEQGLQTVGLAEHDKRGRIEAATEQYMDERAQKSRVRECVQNLKAKQNWPEEGFPRLVEESTARAIIRKYDCSQATRSGPWHLIPFQKNGKFVGRASVIDVLTSKLFADDGEGPQRIALTGLGGVGKTQVALQTAYWVKENKPEWSVFWVPALSMASFEQACRNMAQSLQLDCAEKEDAKELLQGYLNSDASGCWLLVIDNADDEEIVEGGEQAVRGFLPRNSRGRILFTTRARRIATRMAQSEVVDLSQMNGAEARELLKKSLVDKSLLADENLVAELLEILSYLPLAIVQAAAYLNETMTSGVEYLRLLRNTERDAVELLETEFVDDTRYHGAHNAVASTWVLSFEQIRKSADAAMLLSFMAHVESRAIPRSMLPPVGSEQRMTRAIGVLCGYFFLSTREDGTTYDMHRLVHLASRVWVRGQDTASEQKRAVLVHLGGIFSTDEWEEREGWRLLLPHVTKAIEVDEENEDLGEEESYLGYWVGRCLQAEGRSREAVNVLEHVVEVRQRTLAETHPDRLDSQHELATAYRLDGRTKDSLELLERVLAVREIILDEAHPSRLASQHELAGTYRADGQVKKAIILLERVVKVRERMLSETHPDQLDSQHELARAYRADGRVKEAIELLERVVVAKETTLVETHPDRLASQHVLAMAYHADGQVKRAITLLERVVAVQKTTLGETHPDQLDSQHELARAYRADGRVKEAIELLQRVVAVRKTTLAKTHPDRLASQHVLAMAYRGDGRVKEAIALLEQVVAVEKIMLGETHLDRLVSMRELARAYRADGQVKKAAELLELMITIRKRTLSEEDPDQLDSENELALC